MNAIFQNLKKQAYQTIVNALDYELSAIDYAETIEKKFAPEKFDFVGEKVVGDVKEIPIEEFLYAANQGGSYRPGDTAEKVEMLKTAKGSTEIFDFLANSQQLPATNIFHAVIQGENRGFRYIGYGRKIKGDSEIINKLKEDSNQKFEDVAKNQFPRINEQIDNFINKDLKPFIQKAIADEKKRRDDNNNAKEGLK